MFSITFHIVKKLDRTTGVDTSCLRCGTVHGVPAHGGNDKSKKILGEPISFYNKP